MIRLLIFGLAVDTTYCDRSWVQSELFPAEPEADGEKSDDKEKEKEKSTEPAWFEFDDEAVRRIDESEIMVRLSFLPLPINR